MNPPIKAVKELMKTIPKHTNARVTMDSVNAMNKIHQKLKDNDIAVKKYDLWEEAVSLLEKKLFKSDGALR